jgi:hypothetical protein
MYVEGDSYDNPDILSKPQFIQEGKNEQNWDAFSGGDDENTFQDKVDLVDERKVP